MARELQWNMHMNESIYLRQWYCQQPYPVSCKICMRVLLNPHLGVVLFPFMNTMTLCVFMSFFSLSSRGSLGEDGPVLRCLTLDVREATSAPSILSTSLLFLMNIMVGTASICNDNICFVKIKSRVLLQSQKITIVKLPLKY